MQRIAVRFTSVAFKPAAVKDPITERQRSAHAAELIRFMHLDELQCGEVALAELVAMSQHINITRGLHEFTILSYRFFRWDKRAGSPTTAFGSVFLLFFLPHTYSTLVPYATQHILPTHLQLFLEGNRSAFPVLFSVRSFPCTPTDSNWFTPPVDQSVSDVILNGNWSMSNPSPACQCSTPQRNVMLPDCPPAAGGLPPPQVLLSRTLWVAETWCTTGSQLVESQKLHFWNCQS